MTVREATSDKLRGLAVAFLGSNILALVIASIFEYLSLRGFITVNHAWIVLLIVWLLGIVGIVFSEIVWGRDMQHRVRLGIISAIVLAALLFGFDRLITYSMTGRWGSIVDVAQAQAPPSPPPKASANTQTGSSSGQGGIGINNGTQNNTFYPPSMSKPNSDLAATFNGPCNNVNQKGGTATFNCPTYGIPPPGAHIVQSFLPVANDNGTFDWKIIIRLDSPYPPANMGISAESPTVIGLNVSPGGSRHITSGCSVPTHCIYIFDSPAGVQTIDIITKDSSTKPVLGIGFNVPSQWYKPN
ncbi:MAG TPA: hypothetical protein VIJ62_09880 [Rhizomicrobium sp.]